MTRDNNIVLFLFVAMDYFHEWNMRMYSNSRNSIPYVHLLHADARRMKDDGYSIRAIKDRIRTYIDESDAIIVLAGDDANTIMPDADVILADNWMHWGLQYALLVGKPMYGFKTSPHAKIPKPLRGKKISWRKLTLRSYTMLLRRLKSEHDELITGRRSQETGMSVT